MHDFKSLGCANTISCSLVFVFIMIHSCPNIVPLQATEHMRFKRSEYRLVEKPGEKKQRHSFVSYKKYFFLDFPTQNVVLSSHFFKFSIMNEKINDNFECTSRFGVWTALPI